MNVRFITLFMMLCTYTAGSELHLSSGRVLFNAEILSATNGGKVRIRSYYDHVTLVDGVSQTNRVRGFGVFQFDRFDAASQYAIMESLSPVERRRLSGEPRRSGRAQRKPIERESHDDFMRRQDEELRALREEQAKLRKSWNDANFLATVNGFFRKVTVIQTLPDGILGYNESISYGLDGITERRSPTFFLECDTSRLHDGAVFHCFIRPSGYFEYVAVTGAPSKIRKYRIASEGEREKAMENIGDDNMELISKSGIFVRR